MLMSLGLLLSASFYLIRMIEVWVLFHHRTAFRGDDAADRSIPYDEYLSEIE